MNAATCTIPPVRLSKDLICREVHRLTAPDKENLVWSLISEAMLSDKLKTTVLVNLAGTVERMDEQILPALYSFVGKSFQASPSQLGTLTLCRALLQALFSPVSGLCGEHLNQSAVILILTLSSSCEVGTCRASLVFPGQSILSIPKWSVDVTFLTIT